MYGSIKQRPYTYIRCYKKLAVYVGVNKVPVH